MALINPFGDHLQIKPPRYCDDGIHQGAIALIAVHITHK